MQIHAYKKCSCEKNDYVEKRSCKKRFCKKMLM